MVVCHTGLQIQYAILYVLIDCIIALTLQYLPVKTPLQDLARKGSFFLHPCKILQDPVGSCGILRDFVGILQEFCARFLQNPTRSHRILQDLAGMQEKRTFSYKILQECLYSDVGIACVPPNYERAS